MTATYQSLPIPPPSSRSSSRANSAPTTTAAASAFSLTGLKRLFGGAAPLRTGRSRNRDRIAEEADDGDGNDDEYSRPSVAKQHLASVVASLTGHGATSTAADTESGHRLQHDERDHSGSRTRSAPRDGSPAGGAAEFSSLHASSAGGRGGSKASSPARTGTSSETRSHSSSSRSRSRSRAPSASAGGHQHVVQLPDGQRFVRPLRLSGASPSVRVSLQNVETSAILSSSVGGGGGGSASANHGSYGSHAGGRPSSEYRFPPQLPDGSPTLSEDLSTPLSPPPPPPPTEDEPHRRARRLSFSSISGFSSLMTGRNSRGNYYNNNSGSSHGNYNNAVDDDARSVYSVGGTAGVKASPSAYELMRRLRSEGLSTRYWIKDESAKDCFQCGSAFTTFRRRHHCRICGQIFCISCASTILPHFGNLERVRVCDGCRPAAERHESLRLSRTPTLEDDRASVSRYRAPTASYDMPPTPSSARFHRPASTRPRHSRLSTSNSQPGIHSERRNSIGGGEPRSPYAHSPIDEESRSGGAGGGGVQRRISQEAMSTRSDAGQSTHAGGAPPSEAGTAAAAALAQDEGDAEPVARSPALSTTATAPFRRSLGDEEHTTSSSSESPTEAAGTSEEPSPADSPVLHGLGLDLNEVLHDDDADNDSLDEKLSPTTPIPASAAADADADALPLSRGVAFLPVQELRESGQRGPPGFGRSDSRLSGHLIDSLPEPHFDTNAAAPEQHGYDVHRAPVAWDTPLSNASAAHIQRTIRQTLVREKVPSVDAWAPVLEDLLYEVADRLALLDEVEVGNFAHHDHVRVKRIPGGRPRDSEFVSGVVITKNVMHKSMPRHLSNPRIMLLSFPLEYQRNDGQYLSLDKVVTQEHEYLRNLVLRIQDSFPHILLVERNVSQVALDYLLERGIVVARHVKASALASLSHSFGAEIISSMNALLDPRLGRCQSFRVQTFVHPKIPGGRKTFLRFEGDSRSSCTIVLRGGTMDDLAKVKRIINTLVLVVYNAKLESCLLRDERVEAQVPTPPRPGSSSASPALPILEPSVSTSSEVRAEGPAQDDLELSQSFQPYQDVELTGSALVHYPPPYSLQRVAEDARRVKELKEQRDAEEAQRILQEERDAKLESASATGAVNEPLSVEPTSLATSQAVIDTAEEETTVSTASSVVSLELDRPEDLARQALVDEAEAARAQHLADWKAYSLSTPESFDLRDHQRLFVLESLILYRPDAEPSRLCRPPEVRTIDFYRDSDTTIGEYLRKADAALKSDEPCPSPTCNEPLHRHIRVFVHDQVVLRVAWHSCNNEMLQGAIGLSSKCRQEGCHCAGGLVWASAETARLSLGKFFDLSFHPSGMFRCLDESCGHDGQADHIRFWHYGDVRVSITMDYIDLRNVVAPPRKVKVRPDRQVELRNAECAQVQQRMQAYFDSVQARIAIFKLDCVAPERREECQAALDGFSDRCEAERRNIDELLRSTYEQAQHSNGIEMTIVRRALQERSHAFDADWSAFVKRIVPADFSDFRRASAQLKRIFPEAPASVSPVSRVASGVLTPAVEMDEPCEGAEPPPPSPHTAEPSDTLENAQRAAFAGVEGVLSVEPGTEPSVLPGAEGTDSAATPWGPTSTTRTKIPPPLSRSSTISLAEARGPQSNRASHSDVHVSDGTPTGSEEDSDGDKSSVDGSAAADDELDDEHDGPEIDEDGDRPAYTLSTGVQEGSGLPYGPPHLPRTSSSSMSDALVLSHDPELLQSTSVTSSVCSDAAGDWRSMPSPSPAFPQASTFPKLSEGESSGAERKSLFNTFTSLWNYRNGDFATLAYPTLPTEHLYPDNPILIREDEPTSIIAHALSSEKYYRAFETAGLSRIRSGIRSGGTGRESPTDATTLEETAKVAEDVLRGSSERSFKLGDSELGDISARCTVFWVEQFEALRQQCGCGVQFVESLARCFKWDAAGGKSKVDFMKTLDDRFIVKQLSRPEMEVFARFAPAYFRYMADALFHSKPTVLAKVFGIYRISLGKHYRNVDFLVMENLFYGRELRQIFDLKGSTRNRRAEENNPVLLDENLIELSLKSPIYVREESKQLVKEAIYNDSQFLADLNVMDYSLVMGVDATKPELVIGIVDYIRTYTWDKRLESWVKETAFLGGTYKSGGPTVITPKQYKARFREAIDGYLLLSPTPWLNFEKMRTAPKETTTTLVASANDTASIAEPSSSATTSLMEHPHPAPAPPPSDSASIFEAALGPF
ncbi:hypothetical protein JCM3774_004699 [Rhodotorula dairenensis]